MKNLNCALKRGKEVKKSHSCEEFVWVLKDAEKDITKIEKRDKTMICANCLFSLPDMNIKFSKILRMLQYVHKKGDYGKKNIKA